MVHYFKEFLFHFFMVIISPIKNCYIFIAINGEKKDLPEIFLMQKIY